MRIAIVAALTMVVGASALLAQTGTQLAPTAPTPAAPKAAVPTKPASPSPALTEAKKTAKENIAECMRLWEPATHMTKVEWARTCERIQARLENLRVENLDVMGTSVRKKKGPGRQGSLNWPGVWNRA